MMKGTMKRVALVACLFLLIGANVFADESQVTLSIAGRFFSAPIGRSANIRLTAKIVKHESNRSIYVNCDGEMYAGSEKSLEGDNEEKETFDFAFNLQPGSYLCTAILKRMVDGKMKEFTSSVEISVH